MNIEKMSRVQKLTLSAMVIALYVVIHYCTQSFSFGAYQIRIVLVRSLKPLLGVRGRYRNA